ncbi:hypothetical protein GJ496_000009 [Pomphorhynchus laevis]|nr:hypothetical protein GJ496_000009 [Pomphorhynchus laevis]
MKTSFTKIADTRTEDDNNDLNISDRRASTTKFSIPSNLNLTQKSLDITTDNNLTHANEIVSDDSDQMQAGQYGSYSSKNLLLIVYIKISKKHFHISSKPHPHCATRFLGNRHIGGKACLVSAADI